MHIQFAICKVTVTVSLAADYITEKNSIRVRITGMAHSHGFVTLMVVRGVAVSAAAYITISTICTLLNPLPQVNALVCTRAARRTASLHTLPRMVNACHELGNGMKFSRRSCCSNLALALES